MTRKCVRYTFVSEAVSFIKLQAPVVVATNTGARHAHIRAAALKGRAPRGNLAPLRSARAVYTQRPPAANNTLVSMRIHSPYLITSSHDVHLSNPHNNTVKSAADAWCMRTWALERHRTRSSGCASTARAAATPPSACRSVPHRACDRPARAHGAAARVCISPATSTSAVPRVWASLLGSPWAAASSSGSTGC